MSQEHDKYFKQIFSRKEEMTDLVVNGLPQVAKLIDIASLQLDTTEYVDKTLNKSYSDLVYNCKYQNRDIKIALLFEHKSQPELYPHLQLLGYMLQIWQTCKNNKEPLTPIIPILFYHGTENWKHSNFFDSFEDLDDNLKKYIPNFEYELVNTKLLSDKQIKKMFQQYSVKTVMLLMKHIFDEPELLENEIEIIFESLPFLMMDEQGRDLFKTTIVYLFKAAKTNPDKVTAKLKKLSIMGAQIAKTTAEQLEENGIEKGIKQVAINLIKNGHSNELIKGGTGLNDLQINKLVNTVYGLTKDEIERIKKCL